MRNPRFDDTSTMRALNTEALPRDLARDFVTKAFPHAPAVPPYVAMGRLIELVEVLYRASFLADEGRAPNVRCWMAPVGETHQPGDIRLRESVPLTEESVLRLAPALASERQALWIGQLPDEQAIVGIVEMDVVNQPSRLSGWDLGRVDARLGCAVRVLGRAELLVSGNAVTLHLRGTTLTELSWQSSIPQVFQRRLTELAHRVVGTCRVVADRAVFEHAARATEFFWDHTLASVVAHRHGGTFVFAHSATPSAVTLHYCTDALGLADKLRCWVEAASSTTDFGDRAAEEESEAPGRALRAWAARDRLRRQAHALAQLTQVDGCVVLGPNMDILGFGSRLQTQGPEVDGCQVRDPLTNKELARLDLRDRGTRHGSSAAYVRDHPGTLALVVSQDGGGVRAFDHHRGEVVAYPLFTPWSVWSQPH